MTAAWIASGIPTIAALALIGCNLSSNHEVKVEIRSGWIGVILHHPEARAISPQHARIEALLVGASTSQEEDHCFGMSQPFMLKDERSDSPETAYDKHFPLSSFSVLPTRISKRPDPACAAFTNRTASSLAKFRRNITRGVVMQH
jgi:hypothetical protein